MSTRSIGVLSDTHLKDNGKLPREVWRGLEKVSVILHAGDILSPNLLGELEYLAPTYAVQGNCDGFNLSHLPTHRIIEINDLKLGLTHGHLGYGRTTPERAYNMFQNAPPDIIIFGHSHSPLVQKKGDIILFNPGSPTEKRREKRFSFGIITIHNGAIETIHHYF